MVYDKHVFIDNLLSIAESLANTMLYRVDGDNEYRLATPFNIHMYTLSIGVVHILTIPHPQYLRIGNSIKACMLGYKLTKEYLLHYWTSADFTAFINYLKVDYSHLVGVFEFQSKVSSIMENCSPMLTTIDKEEVDEMWEQLDIVIKDDFTKAMISQHFNAILAKGISLYDAMWASLLIYYIDCQLGTMYNCLVGSKVNWLVPPEYAANHVRLKQEFMELCKGNPEATLSSEKLPNNDKAYLNSIIDSAKDNAISLSNDGKELPDDLKRNIRAYIVGGGQPGNVIAYVNKIC